MTVNIHFLEYTDSNGTDCYAIRSKTPHCVAFSKLSMDNQDVLDWFINNEVDVITDQVKYNRVYRFYDEGTATLFKMTFGGTYFEDPDE